MKKITHRQNLILNFIRKNKKASNRNIKQYLENKVGEINRITVLRDLDSLMEKELIEKQGKGRNVAYRLKIRNPLLQYFDVENYFQDSPDQREIQEKFNFDVFNYFTESLFSEKELQHLEKINAGYQKRIKKLSPAILRKEFERLTIELSWKSSQIEGNTYSLIDTEILIKENKEAEGHTKAEAQMILNHKKALDYILDKKSDFAVLAIAKIENLHQIIIENLSIGKNIRKGLVGITGTKFKPLDNEFQIKEALEKTISLANKKNTNPILKSMAAVLLISYIQPFEDGNKRTARLLGNAILLANNYCPLSYRSVDEKDYKKATLLFYEQNSALFFKELFIQQFDFSVKNYFLG